MSLLKQKTSDQRALLLAKYLPNGLPFLAKFITDSNLYKFIRAISVEFGRAEYYINEWIDGRDITKRDDFVPSWEKVVGIPDGDFNNIGTADERRRKAQAKLSAEGVKTREQLEWLIKILGFACKVYPGHMFWPNGTDPRITFNSEKEAYFTVVFEIDFANSVPEFEPNLFPVDFPWVFGASQYNSTVDFIINQVLPAHVNGLFISVAEEENVWQDTIVGPETQDSTDADEIQDTTNAP